MNKSTSSSSAAGAAVVPQSSPATRRNNNNENISTPFFTQAYNRNNKNAEFILFEYQDTFCCLYPMIVPIGK
jgi:hypothetical protein